MTRQKIRVGIIGAGASGLAQIKQLIDAFRRPECKHDLEIRCFEKNSQVGGVWFGDESKQKENVLKILPSESRPDVENMYTYPPEGSDSSPMYDGLRTNLPHDLMAFRDLPMPSHFPLFPPRSDIQSYLESYAETFDLYPHIQFDTKVTRLYHSASDRNGSRRWTINWKNQKGEKGQDDFDFVCCANGHYADGWIPEIPGLSGFKGKVLHSRFFRSAEDLAGKKVLVVGSFASGGDISRLLAQYNFNIQSKSNQTNGGPPTPPEGTSETDGDIKMSNGSSSKLDQYINVHVSCSAPSQYSVNPNDATQPWAKFVTYHPIISQISDTPQSSVIHFEDSTSLSDVDLILFATGYNFCLPFAKKSDSPWKESEVLSGVIRTNERVGGDIGEEGGIKGLGMKGLDELMLFLEGDRSICFPTLPYQVVPFPLAEIQTRLTSLLWAGLLPSFPAHPKLPSNSSNPFSTPAPTPRSTSPPPPHPLKPTDRPVIGFNDCPTPRSMTPATSESDEDQGLAQQAKSKDNKPIRKVLQTRQKLVFGAPYEWTYSEYLMSLMSEADEGEVKDCWRSVEGFRRERRADSELRKRTLGY